MDPHGSWYSASTGVILRELETNPNSGLGASAVRMRQAHYGRNEIQTGRGPSPIAMFASQFQDFMVLVLLGATAVSAILGEYKDVVAIMAIVILNAVLGFVQEFRAERALAALAKMAAPHARAVRSGRAVSLDATELVPGDVVLLVPGDRVPADARLVEAFGLEADESILTGESHPTAKNPEAIVRDQTPIGGRVNMVWAGTTTTRGRARAVVVSTGMDTEMGQIAAMMRDVEEGDTPLQRRLAQLGRWLVAICLGICSAMVAIGIARGEPVQFMFLAGVSLAVAAIPEGLPAIVTVSLALGVQRMSARRAVVRKLAAVETLGCATVICTDKTGTLTQNQLTAVRVQAGGRTYSITGVGYAPHGSFRLNEQQLERPSGDPILRRLLLCAALCNDASISAGSGDASRSWEVVGDPTEAALLAMVGKAGSELASEIAAHARTAELPFTSDLKMMAVTCSGPNGDNTYVKGALSAILPLCSSIAGGLSPANLGQAEGEMAAGAMRVLALAYSSGDVLRRGAHGVEGVMPCLTLLGLVGMVDPLRPEAAAAIQKAARAGIRTIMITGDGSVTARAIASSAGLIRVGQRGAVLTGEQLDQMDDAQVSRAVARASVFARVAPAHKLRIVRALKKQGHVVAMTGDGVNDAPALREADIGIAMGRCGTDVAREASHMVLTDDNYATIIAAVEEGRSIYDNIRKFIRYLLASNVGEMLSMLLTTAIGLPLPLTPIQLLWMNLLTDGLPAMALAADPTDPAAMTHPPRKPNEGVFAGSLGMRIAAQGCFIGACTIACYVLAGVILHRDIHTARTMAFSTLVMSQLIYVFHCRAEGRRGDAPLRPNLLLTAAVAMSVLLQVSVVHTHIGRRALGTTLLSGVDWAFVLFLSGWSSVLTSLARRLRRNLRRRMASFRVSETNKNVRKRTSIARACRNLATRVE